MVYNPNDIPQSFADEKNPSAEISGILREISE